jgi:diguanylate cyclase (GGDEF)-like protein
VDHVHPPSDAVIGTVRSRLTAHAAVIRVGLFSLALAVAAVIVYLDLVRGMSTLAAPVSVPWPLIAVAFFVTEAKVIDVHFRRETHSFSLSELPSVIGFFLMPPTDFLIGLLIGSGVALIVQSRQSPLKVAFNLANYAFIAVVSLTVFRAIGTFAGGPPAPIDWLAAMVATFLGAVISALTIATVIVLSGGAPQFQKLPEMIEFGGLVALANTSLALLAVTILWIDPEAMALLAVPLITLFVAYRAYVSERVKHERLELLYQSSRILQHSPELDRALIALLDHARDMFRAELAEVLLEPVDSAGQPLRTTSVEDGESELMIPVELSDGEPVRLRARTEQRAFFASPARTPGGRRMAIRQAMIAPLVGESGTIGILSIVNRATEGSTFGDDDLRLLETLANQVAVALENGQLEQSLAELGRLKEQLRYQAYHDPLTDLPNRALFAEQVASRLRDRRDDRVPVVLFLDLDDFKVVNDTLGHAAGDQLLVAVAERIRSTIREDDLAARLGGDEFAILVVDQPDLRHSLAVARRLIDLLGVSFPILGQETVVGVSVGIAMARAGQGGAQPEDVDDILRHADVAMYTAKAAGKRRFAVFDPAMHASIVARHELSAELARSVARNELIVHYQPIVALDSGRTVGVEALVRWRHPVRGLTLPDEFITLAEENGTILALGRWVLAEACRTVVALRAAGAPERLMLSVNMSPLQLQRADIVDDIRDVLAETGFDPADLVLELTETAMFRDTTTTIVRLQAIRALGVRIAVDDFGTGYSSLGYLRRFPVDILKIARDFVVSGEDDPETWAFAHAIVALGQTLGLRIVAEGIEEAGQLERLRSLGCEFGQGFLFARPVSAEHLARLLGVSFDGPAAIGRAVTTGERHMPIPVTFPVGG